MITESFLNSCFSISLSKIPRTMKKDKNLFRDVIHILKFYEKKQKTEIPISIKNKFECLKKVCELSIDNKTEESILDSIAVSEKYRDLTPFLEQLINTEIVEEKTRDIINQIYLRKKLTSLLKNYVELNSLVEAVKNCSFDSMDDLILNYEKVVRELYSNMMTDNRHEALEKSSSLDLSKDNYDHVKSSILKKYERANTVPLGYQIFDNYVFNGGIEAGRLYLIGGTSGSGKSTLALNCILNSATKPSVDIMSSYNVKDSETKKVHLYITMENTIDESLLRAYQCLKSKSVEYALKDIRDGLDIRKLMNHEMEINNSSVIMKYYPAYSISVNDIPMIIDDVASEYGRDSIKSVYIDYMDKLRTNEKFDLYRLELGMITSQLKNIAVTYNLPIVTLSQLNRGAYSINNGSELGLNQMSESIKKVEDADSVILLSHDKKQDDRVYMNVAKNRSGKSNVVIDFKVDFSIFKFISGTKVANEKAGSFTGIDSISEMSKFTF